MKKGLLFTIIAILFLSFINITPTSASSTRIYKGENGNVKVPVNPKRVAVLASTYTGGLLHLGITPIAIDKWSAGSKFFGDKLKKATVIGDDSVEKLLTLKPDLIITYTGDKNAAKYKKIAPTVELTYTKYTYLTQHAELGKIVNKEKQAKAWIASWKKKTADARKKIEAKIGKGKTVTVAEMFGKDVYVYGDNWGRGTEILYQELGFKFPKKVQDDIITPKTGYKAISSETLPDYVGDYVFIGKGTNVSDIPVMTTDVWKSLPAVKNKRFFRFDSDSFYFNDPISLEKELAFYVKVLTK